MPIRSRILDDFNGLKSMKGFCRIIFLFFLLIYAGLYTRAQGYTIKAAPFSTRIYNEFSPVFYKDGIAFCSNQGNKSLVGYRDDEGRLFKICYVPERNNTS